MGTSGLKDKIAEAFKGFSIEKCLNFVKKNVRYFTAGALFLALVLILAKCTDAPEQRLENNTEIATDPTPTVAYEVNAIPEITELLTNYYAAYADGKIKQIKQYAKPITKNERSYIKMFSEYVEKYENITCYTKPGVEENAYLVSASIEIKFRDIDTLAPGLDFFYVEKNEDGTFMINNLYSQFNLLNKEKAMDPAVEALIDQFEQDADVIALQTDVQQRFDQAVQSDEKLAKMVNQTIKDASLAWMQGLSPQQPADDGAQQNTEQNTEQTPEPATEEKPEESPSENMAEIVYTTANGVNIRTGADTNAEVVDSVDAGTALTRIAVTDNGWSVIDYDNKECYVKSDYLTSDAPKKPEEPEEPQQPAQGAGQLAEGTEVTLSQSVNVRASMDESANKLGTAYVGEKVTVVMSYAEGWTKVNWKGQTGYIKTEYLK